MAGNIPEPFRKSGGVTIVTAGGDLRAARHRVPCRVGPFDAAAVSHGLGSVNNWRTSLYTIPHDDSHGKAAPRDLPSMAYADKHASPQPQIEISAGKRLWTPRTGPF